jgi:SRSO17 transposase
VRVKTTHDDGIPLAAREAIWLVAEWPEGEKTPTEFFLTTLLRRMSHKQIVLLIKERRRTERMYEDLKGELGLDHFEGRSFPGWHHHVSVVLCCYAFVVAERARAFTPQPQGRVATVRSPSRPKRHFADSFITARLAIALYLARWLPRCPFCHQPHAAPSRCSVHRFTRFE